MEEESRPFVTDSANVVAAAEIRSLKPGARVWEKRTPNVFFLSSKKEALEKLEQPRPPNSDETNTRK